LVERWASPPLGDSLAIGIQPSAKGDVPTNQGYADDLYAVLHAHNKSLVLEKLGCSGETTTSMIEGGICTYAQGSQLAAALAFLQTHTVSLVTIDIGANDIDHCISVTGINTACVTAALASVETNLPQILAELRTAAGPNTLIVGMNYYDPFLAAYVLVSNGQALAAESLTATNGFNTLLESIYQAFSIPVADVATAFQINNTAQVPIIKLPVNVFLTLTLTWMAAPAPLGPNIHPNDVGYAAIAVAFADKVLTP
jgi:lysophospholipase L1-like esterase